MIKIKIKTILKLKIIIGKINNILKVKIQIKINNIMNKNTLISIQIKNQIKVSTFKIHKLNKINNKSQIIDL